MLEGLIIGDLLVVGDRFVFEFCCGSFLYKEVIIFMEFVFLDLKRF